MAHALRGDVNRNSPTPAVPTEMPITLGGGGARLMTPAICIAHWPRWSGRLSLVTTESCAHAGAATIANDNTNGYGRTNGLQRVGGRSSFRLVAAFARSLARTCHRDCGVRAARHPTPAPAAATSSARIPPATPPPLSYHPPLRFPPPPLPPPPTP